MSFALLFVIGVYMCLAIPAEVIKVEGNKGVVDYGGLEQEISLDLVEDVRPGDYVLIHVGFAIEKLSKESALETLAIFKELEELEQENA
jgi:hydrogenase expression/formation protein HypC